MKNFNLQYNLDLFRDEQEELFDTEGERYTAPISDRIAQLMLAIINESEAEINSLEAETKNLFTEKQIKMDKSKLTELLRYAWLEGRTNGLQNNGKSFSEFLGLKEVSEAINNNK